MGLAEKIRLFRAHIQDPIVAFDSAGFLSRLADEVEDLEKHLRLARGPNRQAIEDADKADWSCRRAGSTRRKFLALIRRSEAQARTLAAGRAQFAKVASHRDQLQGQLDEARRRVNRLEFEATCPPPAPDPDEAQRLRDECDRLRARVNAERHARDDFDRKLLGVVGLAFDVRLAEMGVTA